MKRVVFGVDGGFDSPAHPTEGGEREWPEANGPVCTIFKN